jgi:imidazolonepropionase-like amidohydrolase
MLFLSGATFPVSSLPEWARVVAQFLPASYLVTGFQGVFYREESLLDSGSSILALAATIILATFVSTQLFRWEKEEKIRSSAKIYLLAVLVPFFILGGYQLWSRDHLRKADVLWRDLQRQEVLLIRDARIIVGDGRELTSASVLIRNGSIERIFDSERPDPARWNAELVEAAGKTLLPGLIDVHVHLGASGGISIEPSIGFDVEQSMSRALAAYLYSGITAVRSLGDALEPALATRQKALSGELLGAELFLCGPMFTTEGGYGMEVFDDLPEPVQSILAPQLLRLPHSEDEARQQVRELDREGVDAIKAVFESGEDGPLPPRMDVSLLRALAEESAIHGLPFIVHTRTSQDVRDAVDAGARGIEHGAYHDPLPGDVIAQMVEKEVFYSPTLSMLEARAHVLGGVEELLERSLTQQVNPLSLIEKAREALRSTDSSIFEYERLRGSAYLEHATENLTAAYRNGIMLVTGSDGGHALVFHGPTIHRELQLWVRAGVPEAAALRAATYDAARYLGAEDRLGLVAPGYEANLLLVDGNPLKDITATERISLVIFRGERIRRSALFDSY